MIIDTVTMPREELLALLDAAQQMQGRLIVNSKRWDQIDSAIDRINLALALGNLMALSRPKIEGIGK